LRLLVTPTWWISLTKYSGKDPIAFEVHMIQSSIIFIYTVASEMQKKSPVSCRKQLKESP